MEEKIILAVAVILVLGAALVVITFPIHLVVWLTKKIRSRRNPARPTPNSSAIIGHFAIVGIILVSAVIAIPNFLKFSSKSPQSEAKTNLGAIYVAQLSYFSNANTYANGPDTFKLINWEPAGQNRYAYYCQGAMIPNKYTKQMLIPPDPDWKWPVEIWPATSQDSFTCLAIGNVDKDDTLDVWSINDAKILRNDLNDANLPLRRI